MASHCEASHHWQEIWQQMLFLETLPASNNSCYCIVEHPDNHTTVLHDCHSPLCPTTDPPTTNISLLGTVGNHTSWFYTHCCLPAVSVSWPKEEKSLLQCKTLWKHICTSYCDYFSCRTHCHADSSLWADADFTSTNWDWNNWNSALPAAFTSTVCTRMVCEKKVPESSDEWVWWNVTVLCRATCHNSKSWQWRWRPFASRSVVPALIL